MCTLHYQRWQVHGALDLPIRPTKTESGTFQHGTPQGYNFHKCRCSDCSAWRREYNRGTTHLYEETRRRHQLAQYGITPEDYARMLAEQDDACAVCRMPQRPGRIRNLHVDHDHVTGRVRGLLCHNCNVAAGQMQDDPALVDALAAYLRRSS